jgi:hypothetical protein
MPAVTTFGNAGLVWNDPTAWQLDQVGTVRAITNIRKRMRYIGFRPKQPNAIHHRIAIGEKVP